MKSRERVLAMVEGRPVDHLPLMPITMMLAGDQIGAKYGDYARDHRVLVEGQLRTAEAFGFDYVSAISDPAREAADCGAEIAWFEDQPPAIIEERALLAGKGRLARLQVPDPRGGGRMGDRVKAVALLRQRAGADLLVEGWVEGPCAEAADLRGINAIMTDFFDDPDFVEDLFEFVIEMELRFAGAQVEAGCDIIGVGDAAASLVGPRIYERFVWPYEKKLVDGLHALGTRVRLHICGNTRPLLAHMGRLGCEIVDLDSPPLPQDLDLPAGVLGWIAGEKGPSPARLVAEGREKMGPDQVLLGNLHPVHVVRNGTPDDVTRAVAECHAAAGPRFIVGAGCEVPRGTPAANVIALRDYARGHRP